MNLKRLSPALVLLASLALAQKTGSPVKVKVGDLLKSGAKYDQKLVTVDGIVKWFKPRKSRAGNDYLTFNLLASKDALPISAAKVYSYGKLTFTLKDGAKVRVTGVFRLTKKLGDREIKNEIDASPKKGVKDGKPAVIILK